MEVSVTNTSQVLSLKKQQNHQMSYSWRVLLPTLTEEGIAPEVDRTRLANNTSKSAIQLLDDVASSDTISTRVYSITVPGVSFEIDTYATGVTTRKRAGSRTYGDIELTVDELEDGQTNRYFYEWLSLIKNSDGTMNYPSFYQRDLVFYFTSVSGLELNRVTLKGCFPSNITPSNFGYDEQSISNVRVTLACESIDREFIPISDIVAAIESRQSTLAINVLGYSSSTVDGLAETAENVFSTFGI